jgi:ribosomal protein S18 acetylase RimI-like enzyme
VTIAVRRALAPDAAPLATLAAATFGLACPPETTEAAKADFISRSLSETSFRSYLADPLRELLVAADDHEGFIGYTMIVFAEPADDDVRSALSLSPSVELSKCYVLASHHSRGVAAELMRVTLAAARRPGFAGVWLGVNEQNVRAQRFYAKSGFQQVGTRRFLVGDRFENDWVMQRPLSSAAR